MKNLSNLRPAPGSNKSKKRIGRGIGSGWGKTAGKGHKGQKARKGCKITPGFEGGQTPLYRRVPKRGFHNLFATAYSVVNIDSLNCFESNTVVTAELLQAKGLIDTMSQPVKILGRGELTRALKIQVNRVSQSARNAVLKAGGTIEEI